MARRTLLEIDGKQYMTPKPAGDKWGLSTQAVTVACAEGRVAGATQDSSTHWIIPIDATKPLDNQSIKEILIKLLFFKNWPDSPFPVEVEQHFEYLKATGYIDGTDSVCSVLTVKGMKVATSGKSANIDWVKVSDTITQVVIGTASALNKMRT